MKKITLLLLCTVASSCLFGQNKKPASKPVSTAPAKEAISYFKIENGVKTKVDPNVPFEIKMDDKGKPATNMEVVIEIAEWRKKFPYDVFQFVIHNVKDDKNFSLKKFLDFGQPESAKKWTNMKTVKFLLFTKSEVEYENHIHMLYLHDNIYTSMANDTLDFRILGAYSNGTETYFDKSSESVKTRTQVGSYTNLRPFTKMVIKYDPVYLLKVESKDLRYQIDDNDDATFRTVDDKTYPTIKGLCDQWIASFSKESNEMPSAKKFIQTYMNTKLDELRKNTDNVSYIKEVSAFMKTASCFDFTNVSQEDKKVMDKLIKKSSMPLDDIFKLFPVMNPDHPIPNCNYAALLPK